MTEKTPKHVPLRKSSAVSLDLDKYLVILEDHKIPQETKKELIETLWATIVSFVEIGFTVEFEGVIDSNANRQAPRGALTREFGASIDAILPDIASPKGGAGPKI